MKLNLVTLLLLGLLPALGACSDDPNNPASTGIGEIAEGRSRSDMRMQKLEINLGTVFQRMSYDLEFPFDVNGPDPIIIEEIGTSCGCTSARIRPDWDPDFEGEFWPLEQPIPAGAKGAVVAIFDGSLYKEEKASTITIHGNFLSNKVTLGVEAFIEPVFHVEPAGVNFRELQLTDLAKAPVVKQVKVTAMKPFQITRWSRVSPGFLVKEVGEAQILEEGRMSRTYEVIATSDLEEGRLNTSIIAETDLDERLEWVVSAHVVGPVKYSPVTTQIAFGVVNAGKAVKRKLTVESTGPVIPEPTFEIVGNIAKVLEAHLETGVEGKKYVIRMAINKDGAAGRYDGLLRVSFPASANIPTREAILKALIR